MAIGVGTIFLGYWLGYFGWCSLRGPGVGLLDLIVPGRSVTIPAGSSGGSGTATVTPAGIAAVNKLTCAQIKALPSNYIASILATDPTFAVRLAQCGFTAPTQGVKGPKTLPLNPFPPSNLPLNPFNNP